MTTTTTTTMVNEQEIERKPVIRVLNKSDLLPEHNGPHHVSFDKRRNGDDDDDDDEEIRISCVTGDGLSTLTAHLSDLVKRQMEQLHAGIRDTGAGKNPNGVGVSLLNRARHRHHVRVCIDALKRYEALCCSSTITTATGGIALEVAAEELRTAGVALGRVVGTIDTESVLDSIFSEFCIGK